MEEMYYLHPDAKIGENVTIEPFAYIAADTIIGDNCWIGPHAVIMEHVRIGNGCRIFPGAVVGAIPQDLKFSGELSYVEIGDNTTIRECATINRGTAASGKALTKIGNNCLIMSYAHIAHDCHVGDNCILVSHTGIAGETDIDDWAIIGGGTMAHQFSRIGAHAMIGGASAINKDIPPYILAARNPIAFEGINIVGLRRRGFTIDDIEEIKNIYSIIYDSDNNVTDACRMVSELFPESKHSKIILDFIKASKRGIVK
ncbi:MAG: acyl-ACP--UDP-N-acetylglucosamine O-acyltransferase [Bacteroidales bacterium]|jgi:UDP-N-acetylglucosamine acyltransferase|nr:acyl-ACP--UDP-N-acetylglucosamine O-acyltransferase [Bacteroidales bacterium]